MDRLNSMMAFVSAVETGSFAAAAEAMGVSPQMVAKHVSYLEARMGTRLLNRTTRQQGLTGIGRTYYERCKVVLAELNWAESLAEEARGVPRGRLRINAPVSFGTSILTPIVANYLREYPEVEIDLVLSDRFVDPIDEEFEAVFRIGPLDTTTFKAIEISPFVIIPCASPAYLGERAALVKPADLAQHECLSYAHSPTRVVTEWNFIRDGSTFTTPIRSRLKVNNAAALIAAALAGFGIALVAKELAQELLSSGRLIRVLPEYEIKPRPIHIIVQTDRRPTPKLTSFLDFVTCRIGVEAGQV